MFIVAEQLLLDDLKLLCEEGMVTLLTIENLLEILSKTHNLNISQMLKKDLYSFYFREFDKICNY